MVIAYRNKVYGSHNLSKAKVFIILSCLKHNKVNTGLNAQQISLSSGVSYAYLLSRLGKWHQWGYLNRRAAGSDKGRAIYNYSIAKRGEYFLNELVTTTVFNQLVEDIKAFQSQPK